MLSALAAGPLGALGAPEAAVPRRKSQAPGFYRMMLGDFEVTALCDGTIDFPMDKILTNAKPGEVDTLFREAYLQSPIRTSVNQFLIDTGSKLVLVDTGAGGLLGPALGRLPENLRAAGYDPGHIDEILLTHGHVDHVGGLSHNGKMNFSNAKIRVSNSETHYWLHTSADETLKAALGPYIDSGRVEAFEGAAVLVPGISAVPAHGHTPGHTFYRISSKGEELLLIGDAVHAAAVQFADPGVTAIWDSNPHDASAQRKHLLVSAAEQGFLTGGAHIAFPGLGRVRARGRR